MPCLSTTGRWWIVVDIACHRRRCLFASCFDPSQALSSTLGHWSGTRLVWSMELLRTAVFGRLVSHIVNDEHSNSKEAWPLCIKYESSKMLLKKQVILAKRLSCVSIHKYCVLCSFSATFPLNIQFSHCLYSSYLSCSPYFSFLENVLDPAHVPVRYVHSHLHHVSFMWLTVLTDIQWYHKQPLMINEHAQSLAHICSHHNVVGNRYSAQCIHMEYVEQVNANGFVTCTSVNGNPWSIRTFMAPTTVATEMPLGPDGAQQILELYVSPSWLGFCNHVGCMVLIKPASNAKAQKSAFKKFTFPVPLWLHHVMSASFLNQVSLLNNTYFHICSLVLCSCLP